MGKHGQYVYKGINAQSWAAMALFLQYLRDPSFSCIQLEAPCFEDFNLVFTDGHKVICESKAYKRSFGYATLKAVLRSMKKKTIGENDEILIICANLDKRLESRVESFKYFKKLLNPEFKKRGFKEEELLMLPKVKFWESPKSISQQIVFSLFSELVNFWLPEGDLKRILDNILIEKIYEGSEKGQVYYKTDILSEIDNLQKATVKKSGHFDRERISTEAQLDNIIVAIENDRSPLWAENQLSAISARPNLMYFILDKFKNKKIDNLEEWKDLWQLNRIYGYSFNISRIFENNCHTEGNRRYVLNFIKETIPNVRRFYRNDYFYTDSVRIIKKIVDCDRSFLNEAFEIVKILLSSYENDYFYLKKDHSLDYEKAEVCKVLSWIFRNAKSILREKIYQFTSSYFNLIEDQGEYSHYTPLDIFNILHEHLISDSNKFEDRFVKLSEELSEQYSRFYKSRFGRKERFTGWELMGGMTSFWGGEYKISDRHFVGYILAPALSNYYQRNRHKAWKFILKDCITKENSVSKEQPDFLNRAAFIVVLNRFKSNNKEVANAAFRILKEFVLSRKGIPHKSELIYQEVSSNAPNNKKWRLVSLSIKKFKVPTSPFVEQIVSDLARDGHTKSKYILRQWSKNPDYYKKTKFLGNDLIGHITSLLSNSFEDAIEMFENYINGDYFINNLDSFDVYKVAGLLNGILKKDFTLGLNILNGLKCKENLSKNQQILLCFSLLGSDDKNTDECEWYKRIYEEFVDVFLEELGNDINKIYGKIPHSNAREAFAQFAEKLARHKMLNKAIRIIKVFAEDPDPFLPGEDPEDKKGEYSHHKKIVEEAQGTSTINSVRGWCAWTLAHCVILEGRKYISELIDLSVTLSQDKDYYIRHMACFPLSRLVRFRLSHMPEKKSVLFFSDHKEIGLRMAKRVEKIALDLLHSTVDSSVNVRKTLARSVLSVVNNMRTLTEKEALSLIDKLRRFPNKSSSEIAPLIIYYAEFRESAFKKWHLSLPGLYDDVQQFDSRRFKKILKEVMLKSGEAKAAFSWQFYKMTDSALRKVKNHIGYSKAFDISLRYIKEMISDYDHEAFEHIYRFIEENIVQPRKFDICYRLWRECLKKEKQALGKLAKEGKMAEAYWWPYHYNGKILTMVNQKKGRKRFLDSLEFLSEYPKEVDIGGIVEAVVLLKRAPRSNKQTERIFNNLIERNSNFYNDKQEWRRQ